MSLLLLLDTYNSSGGADMLVSLADVKDYLDIPADDTVHDAALLRAIDSVRPVIENITGPIIVTTFTEKHDGGSPFIQIRRRPSSSFGTTPVLELLSVSEDLGSTAYDLQIVGHPALGSSYSCMIDSIGTVSRLSGGGGRQLFAGGIANVTVSYSAGQSSVPANVYTATLELIRTNWQTTRSRGSGRLTIADDQDGGVPLHFFVSRRVHEMLAPNRRAPSIA